MIKFTLNGKKASFKGAPFTRLIDVIREHFALTGTKEGCGEGECGACTVLLDGAPINSCLIAICQAEGRKVETVEALGKPDKLSKLQAGFLGRGGAQCGRCTPGMLMSAHAHLKSGGKAEDQSVRAALAGNLCRCTGYQDIVQSVIAAAKGKTK